MRPYGFVGIRSVSSSFVSFSSTCGPPKIDHIAQGKRVKHLGHGFGRHQAVPAAVGHCCGLSARRACCTTGAVRGSASRMPSGVVSSTCSGGRRVPA